MRRWGELAVAALIGGLVARGIVWFLRNGVITIKHLPIEMTYSDLAATMLAAASLLVTILGIFVAILAFVGYTQFRGMVLKATTTQISKELPIQISKELPVAMRNEFSSKSIKDLVHNRVDALLYGSTEISDSPDEMKEE